MKVTLHKSSDGVLHETYAAFAAAEARLKIIPELEAAQWNEESITDHCLDVDDITGIEFAILPMSRLSLFIAENADVIRTILNNATVVRRGRKPAEMKP